MERVKPPIPPPEAEIRPDGPLQLPPRMPVCWPVPAPEQPFPVPAFLPPENFVYPERVGLDTIGFELVPGPEEEFEPEEPIPYMTPVADAT